MMDCSKYSCFWNSLFHFCKRIVWRLLSSLWLCFRAPGNTQPSESFMKESKTPTYSLWVGLTHRFYSQLDHSLKGLLKWAFHKCLIPMLENDPIDSSTMCFLDFQRNVWKRCFKEKNTLKQTPKNNLKTLGLWPDKNHQVQLLKPFEVFLHFLDN